jgi:SIT4 phosphatase-associated protein
MDRGYNRTLAIDLFDTGDITDRIVEGQKKSDEAQESDKMRLGYMGHLTLIAEEVVKFTERHPPELLSESVLEKVTNAEWNTYVEVTLAETRERDNAILGGVRPDMSVGPRQAVMNAVNAASGFNGASSALSEAGLNGSAGLEGIELSNGNGLTSAGFTITGGSLLSGFGSSSDDEDEEMDEDNEEEGPRNVNSGSAEVGDFIHLAPKKICLMTKIPISNYWIFSTARVPYFLKWVIIRRSDVSLLMAACRMGQWLTGDIASEESIQHNEMFFSFAATVMALDISPRCLKPQFQFSLYISHKCDLV